MKQRALHCTTGAGTVVQVRRYAPHERQSAHFHESTSMTLIVRGSLEECVGSETARGSALSVVVKPAGVEHRDRFGSEGATTLQVVLSHADEAAMTQAGPGLSEWRWIHAGEVARPLVHLLRLLVLGKGPGDQDPGSIEDHLLEAVAYLQPATGRRAGRAPDWLLRVRNALESEALPIRTLAAESRVHPVRLAREFRSHFGVAPSAYRRRFRLRRAARLLAGSQIPLVEAAFQAGYADQAHMTRELRASIGETPRAFRRLVAGV